MGLAKTFFGGPLILKDFKTTATLRRRDAPSTPNWHPKGFLPKRFFLGSLDSQGFHDILPFLRPKHPPTFLVRMGFSPQPRPFPPLPVLPHSSATFVITWTRGPPKRPNYRPSFGHDNGQRLFSFETDFCHTRSESVPVCHTFESQTLALIRHSRHSLGSRLAHLLFLS